MLLYHGSKEIVQFPEIRKALYQKDFYFGFYCTNYIEQAERWATRFGKSGYINIYEYTPDPSLRYLKFEDMTEEWLDFIVSCRLGNPHTYDMVEGPMANDTIFNYVQKFCGRQNFQSSVLGTCQIQPPDTSSEFSYNICIEYTYI